MSMVCGKYVFYRRHIECPGSSVVFEAVSNASSIKSDQKLIGKGIIALLRAVPYHNGLNAE